MSASPDPEIAVIGGTGFLLQGFGDPATGGTGRGTSSDQVQADVYLLTDIRPALLPNATPLCSASRASGRTGTGSMPVKSGSGRPATLWNSRSG